MGGTVANTELTKVLILESVLLNCVTVFPPKPWRGRFQTCTGLRNLSQRGVVVFFREEDRVEDFKLAFAPVLEQSAGGSQNLGFAVVAPAGVMLFRVRDFLVPVILSDRGTDLG